jgi:hypothetical protein
MLESKINYDRLLRLIKRETKRLYKKLKKNLTPKGGVILILQSFLKKEMFC